jgi:hypothetical protein
LTHYGEIVTQFANVRRTIFPIRIFGKTGIGRNDSNAAHDRERRQDQRSSAKFFFIPFYRNQLACNFSHGRGENSRILPQRKPPPKNLSNHHIAMR